MDYVIEILDVVLSAKKLGIESRLNSQLLRNIPPPGTDSHTARDLAIYHNIGQVRAGLCN